MRIFGTNSRWAFHVKFIQNFPFSVMVLQYQIRNILCAFLTGQQFPIQVHFRQNPAFSVKFSIYVHFLVILFHWHITSMFKPMDTMENLIWERFSLIKENSYFSKFVIRVREPYYGVRNTDHMVAVTLENLVACFIIAVISMFGITLGRYQINHWKIIINFTMNTNFEIIKVGNFQFVNVRFVHFLGAFLGTFQPFILRWNSIKIEHNC